MLALRSPSYKPAHVAADAVLLALRARVLVAARVVPSATRRTAEREGPLWALLGAAGLLAVFAAAGGASPDAPSFAALAPRMAASTSAALIASWGALGRGGTMLGRPRALLLAIAALVPLASLASMLTLKAPGAGAASEPACFTLTLLLALGPLVAVARARQGSDPHHPRAAGAAIGAAVASWAAVAADLHCDDASFVHLALGHALPLALLAAVGALAGDAVLGSHRVDMPVVRLPRYAPHLH